MKIGITGATGNLGRLVTQHIIDKVGPTAVVALARNPDAARAKLGEGIEARRADYDDAATLGPAFEGLDRLILIPTAGSPAERRVQHDNVVAAAERAGVKHVIYAGFIDNDAASPFWPAATIAYTEGLLVASSLEWTFLRNGVYTELLQPALQAAKERGVYTTTAQRGATAYVALADLAAATSVVATEDGHAGKSYRLSGERVTEGEIAAALGDVLGKSVDLAVISEDALRGHLGEAADLVLAIHRAVAGDFFDHHTDALERLLGRAPVTIRETLKGMV